MYICIYIYIYIRYLVIHVQIKIGQGLSEGLARKCHATHTHKVCYAYMRIPEHFTAL